MGKTDLPLRERIRNHRSSIRVAYRDKGSELPVAKHFLEFNHPLPTMKFLAIDHIPQPLRRGDRKKLLLQRELHWIRTLHTVQPKGLNEKVTLPYSQSGIQIERIDADLKISVKLMLVLVWHEDKSVQLTLNKKYMGETCGLCSNYDSDQKNDFTGHGKILTPLKFGNLQKLMKPGQKCIDPNPKDEDQCRTFKALSYKMLASSMWAKCNRLVKVTSYIKAYMEDLCLCNSSSTLSYFCKCNTISEYSRQCALAGGKPPDWRNYELCWHWNCEDLPCPSSCSVEGGSHITTFDKVYYTFHGKCLYVLTKPCADNAFLVTVEMQKCAYSETATCLTRVLLFLDNGENIFEIKYDNSDFPQVTYDVKKMAQGLCGNFNNIQKDDFRTSNGAIEGNVADFANTWKTQHSCMNIQIIPEHPCTYGLEIEKYAHYWCNILIDSEGPFSACHASVNPEHYQQNCLFDTCSCKRAEDCLCASLSSYAWACAVAGIPLIGWREEVCRNYMSFCPPTFVYSYSVTTCIPTCRSLNEPDPTCSITFFPVDGCVCPPNTYLDDHGVCVKMEHCSCYYKGVPVFPDKPLYADKVICVCKNRTWVCDKKPDKGICTVYGEGHHMTFDNKWYTASGDCEYTLLQDYCDADHLQKGTFRINIENIPCGTTGTSCSKAILVYLGVHKLILADGQFEVVRRASNIDIPYKIRSMGNFLVIETMNGIVLIWDRKTSIFIHLSIAFKGKVCGLCGNFDGNSNNDFTTRSQCVVEEVTEFRDSWRLTPECPEVYITKEPCAMNPYRVPWAQKRCSIITSEVFSTCHDEVDSEKYYESCVSDTCACDVGGDCECLCTAIAAYAQACSEACVCVDWRTPDVCPMFCDFYNTQGHCEWHYRACGAPCMKTCRNPSGICMHHLKGLEGCYPVCPEEKPYFSEDEMLCVSQCGCLDDNNNYYKIGEKVESCNSCESW
ncbi:mucin-5B-like [Pelobates fuscus]|uniref:mucin-5B-like n=1 Tax=Pelobates fuscus TaxID=191477 RepID=UPI002FE4EC23